jgi:tRNA pseudouridine55 synthase
MSLESSLSGALIVDKPSGPTSHDMVALARRALREPRIGHTGTLDPLATGVLILLVGRATRVAQYLVSDEKEYLADVRLGISTPTYDAQSLPEQATLRARPSSGTNGECPAFVVRALEGFRGTFLQTPPPHSAKKVGGRRAYERARNEQPVELPPVEVAVSTLQLVSCTPGLELALAGGCLRLRIVCSAGFYVRSLAHDLGEVLGCGAHLEALRRIRAGRFGIDRAVTAESIATDPEAIRDRWIGTNELLGHLAAITVSEEGARRVAHGNTVSPEHIVRGEAPTVDSGHTVRLLDGSGSVLAIAERRGRAGAVLQPLTVLV